MHCKRRGQGLCPMCYKPGSGADFTQCVIHPGAFFACHVMFSLNHLQYMLMVANRQCSCHPAPDVWQFFYGRLESIWDLVLPASHTLHLTQPTQFLLALVMPCSTRGKDVTKEVTTYHSMMTSIIINLRVVECVVGHMKHGNDWGIIDRSGDFACTVFVDPEDDGD